MVAGNYDVRRENDNNNVARDGGVDRRAVRRHTWKLRAASHEARFTRRRFSLLSKIPAELTYSNSFGSDPEKNFFPQLITRDIIGAIAPFDLRAEDTAAISGESSFATVVKFVSLIGVRSWIKRLSIRLTILTTVAKQLSMLDASLYITSL